MEVAQPTDISGDPQAVAPAVRARALAYLFAVGGSLGMLSLLVPRPEGIWITGVVGSAVAALLAAAVLWRFARSFSTLGIHVALAFGTVCVSVATVFAGGESSFALYYVWVGIYAYYFFPAGPATLQVAGVAAAYGAALALGDAGSAAEARWGLTLGTLVVAGTLIARLAREIRARAEASASDAKRLHDAELRTRAILETSQEAYIAMDSTGLITAWNTQAEQVFGFPHAEALGRRLSELVIPPHARAAHEAGLRRFTETGRSDFLGRRVVVIAQHRDGSELPVELSISPLEIDGQVTFHAFLHDVTERREAEARRERDQTRIREQAEDLATIAGVARELSAVTDAHGARVAVCRAATDVTDASIAILFEPDATGRELVSTATQGVQGQLRLPFAAEPSGAGVAFSTLEPFFVADVHGHPSVSQRLADQLDITSALWQPVVRNGIAVGVLTVAWAEPVLQLSERVESLLGLLADEAAVAIERANLLAQLETVARTDDLTGLANRRAWDEELPRELARARREGTDVCVAMLDLDRFKQFNDEYGHQAGDRLLRQLAAIWRESLRPTDFVARYGGEEFVVLLPGCSIEEARPVVERLREAAPLGQTCSAGMACWNGSEGPDELVDRADVALYLAKGEGRDCTIIAA